MTESSITITLLGAFAAKNGDGAEVVLPKKARALLAFLIVNRGRQISRDELAALLWSNTNSEQARQSLRQCLSVLRRAFHPYMTDWLAVQADALTLAIDTSLACDVMELKRLEQSGGQQDLINADKLYQGEFLAGLCLSGEPFEDWVAAERQRFSSVHLRILTALAGLQAQASDLAGAVETARRLTALDPYREESSRLLMELLAASGQRGLALIEHARVERVLREDLQLAPDATTRALAEKIRRGQTIPSQMPPGSASLARETFGVAPAPRYQYTASDRAVVAILPFTNLTGEPDQDHFAYSLTEDVAAALVKERWPVIVATPVNALAGQLASALDQIDSRIDYVASASVRRDDKRTRIMARLTDARSGQHLWSDRIEAEAESFFALQDELSSQIVARLAPAIRIAEIGRVTRKPVDALTPYELYLYATAICRRGHEGNARALRMLRRAIDLDPNFGLAHGLAARCFHLRRLMGWADPGDPALYDGVRLAHRAAELSDDNPEALWMAGLAMAIIDGNMRDGHYLIGRSLAISQSNASAWIASCFVHAHSGDAAIAVERFNRAQAVNPDDASQHLQWHAAATAYFVGGRYEEAESATERALERTPSYPGSLRMQIALAGLSGHLEKAHDAARLLMKVNPDASIANMQSYCQPLMSHTPDAVAALINGWRRAGMPSG